MTILTMQEVSTELKVAVETLRYWRWRGEGPRSFKVGRKVVYDRADLDEWLAEQRASAATTAQR